MRVRGSDRLASDRPAATPAPGLLPVQSRPFVSPGSHPASPHGVDSSFLPQPPFNSALASRAPLYIHPRHSFRQQGRTRATVVLPTSDYSRRYPEQRPSLTLIPPPSHTTPLFGHRHPSLRPVSTTWTRFDVASFTRLPTRIHSSLLEMSPDLKYVQLPAGRLIVSKSIETASGESMC